MPRYEIVAHVVVDLEGSTPEAAAAAFKRDVLARSGDEVALRGLAVWRPTTDPASTPLPTSAQRHLADFFAGVARSAATAEEAFRVRVEEILASTPRDAVPDVLARELVPVVVEGPGVNGDGTDGWESDGGAIARGGIETEDLP